MALGQPEVRFRAGGLLHAPTRNICQTGLVPLSILGVEQHAKLSSALLDAFLAGDTCT